MNTNTHRVFLMDYKKTKEALKHKTFLARLYFALSILFLTLWLTK